MLTISSFFILCGLVLQVIALSQFAKESSFLLLAWMFNFIASYCIVIAIDQFKKFLHNYNNYIRFLFFLFTFLIPILGLIASLLIARWLYLVQQRILKNRIEDFALDFSAKQLRSKYGVGGLRVNLQMTSLTLANRMGALKTLSSMAPNKINNLVRQVLPDSTDELRLLAFHILNRQEKKIIPAINKALLALKENQTPLKRAELERWLALEYWELFYRHLIEPSLVDFILHRSLAYANQALKYFANDPALWFLLGRIYCREKNFDKAMEAFVKSIAHGASSNRIIPYLSEVYFYQRNFEGLKLLVAAQPQTIITQISKSITDFWSKPHA